jgi:hypothetical protein
LSITDGLSRGNTRGLLLLLAPLLLAPLPLAFAGHCWFVLSKLLRFRRSFSPSSDVG